MIKNRILAVSDDIDICRTIKAHMQDRTTDVNYVTSVSEVLDSISKLDYSLVILNNRLSEISTLEMVRSIRLIQNIPVLVLTVPLGSDEKIELFQAGTDAIIEEPLNMDICIAQARALIQLCLDASTKYSAKDQISFGQELIIVPRHRQVYVDEKPLTLTPKEFDLLHHFACHQYQVFSKKQLYLSVWNYDCSTGGDETVRVHIQMLRKKLEAEGKHLIQNVRGIGYKFVPPGE